jgi:myosin heavy subunit
VRDGSSLVSGVVETTLVEQKQILERGGEKVDILADRLTPIQWLDDAAQGKAAQAPQSAPAWERKQALQYGEQWSGAGLLGCTLSSSLGELDALRSAAEAARIKQGQALDQERDRADALARELTSLWAAIDTARIVGSPAAQAPETQIKQRQALEQERGRADALARELTSLRAELDAARIGDPEFAQAAAAAVEQKQALKQELKQERDRAETLSRELTSLRAELDAARIGDPEFAQAAAAAVEQKQALKQELNQERDRAEALTRELTSLRTELHAARVAGPEVAQAAAAEVEQKQALKQERDRAEALARELTSLRAELDTARAAGLEAARTGEAAKIEQELAFGKEHDKAERLARELASARKEAEERSALLAAAHAEVLQVTETNSAIAAEQKLALASEHNRADALGSELTSIRNELEAGNRQIAALNAAPAQRSCEPAVDSPQARVAASSPKTTEGKGRPPEQASGEAVASTSGRASASELRRPEAQSAAREAASDLDTKVVVEVERSSASAAPHSRAEEQRLLARANALLRQADISGARPLLEHALERGSARAAFMLAETYDAHVLQSWRARGISGDPTKARELYERAQAGGIEDAKERIEALK